MAPHLSVPRLPWTGPAGEPEPTRSYKMCLITCRGFSRMGNQAYSPLPAAEILPSVGKKLFKKKKGITELALKNESVFSGESKSCRNHRKIQGNKINGAHILERAQSGLCRSRSRRPRPGPPRQGTGAGAVGRGLPRAVTSELTTWPFTAPLPCWAAEGPWVPRLKSKERSPRMAVTKEPLTPAMDQDPPATGASPHPPLLDGQTAPSSIRGSETDTECRVPLMNGRWNAGDRPAWPRTGRRAAP